MVDVNQSQICQVIHSSFLQHGDVVAQVEFIPLITYIGFSVKSSR